MKLRPRKGATISLVGALLLVLVLIGCALFCMARILGGGAQNLNASDAGALAAARSILAVGLDQSAVTPEFQGLGVNVHNGQPDPVNGLMNVFAYNRCAGLTALIAMNALEEGTPTAISNANAIVASLQTFGDALSGAMVASGQLGSSTAVSFENVAQQNNVNMLGQQTSANLAADLDFGSVKTGSAGGGGKSDVYFNSATFGGNPFFTNLEIASEDYTGSIRSSAYGFDINAPSYEAGSMYQNGRPLLRAYEPIVLDPRIAPIYLCAVNPTSKPHLIESGRYNDGAPRFGYAPPNTVRGQTQTVEQYKTGALVKALSYAIIGGLYNEYPISLPHGYIRIRNGPDVRVANPGLPPIDGFVDGTNNIFNNELWLGAGGGGGIFMADNGTFGTANSGAGWMMENFAIYNSSWQWTSYPDDFGLDAWSDPSDGIYQSAQTQQNYAAIYQQSAFNPANGGYPYIDGDPMIRITGNTGQVAHLWDMLGIQYLMYYCNTISFDIPTDQICEAWLGTFIGNYGSGYSSGPPQPGSTLTGLEYKKGEVVDAWIAATQSGNFANYTYTISGVPNDSGSKDYQRYGVGYACPTNTANGTIAFGTVGTPGSLLDQLTQNGAGCINTNDPAIWTNPNTIQGKLFQRCQEICPSVDWTTVWNLLYAAPIDLGQCQYIFEIPGSNTLTISTSPPGFLQNLPEFTNPGITQADGTVFRPGCAQDTDFTGSIGNQVDAQIGVWGNGKGDNCLHDMPFTSFNGSVDTWDYCTWQASSGANDFLGELSFYNHVDANGTFSAPN